MRGIENVFDALYAIDPGFVGATSLGREQHVVNEIVAREILEALTPILQRVSSYST
jgi:hypothetical protein